MSQGDFSGLYELQDDDLFNELFPRFNFQLYAAEAGLPEWVNVLSQKEMKESFEVRAALRAERALKAEQERIHANLYPVFKPLVERPILERAVGIYTFYGIATTLCSPEFSPNPVQYAKFTMSSSVLLLSLTM
jgi:hypothetical protein